MERGRSLNILIIEDDEDDYFLAREALAGGDSMLYQFGGKAGVTWAPTLHEGLEAIRGRDFDVALLDLSLPDARGLEALAAVRTLSHILPVVVLTGLDDQEVAAQALSQGAQDYVIKGQSSVVLPRAVAYAIERQRALLQLTAQEKLAEDERRFREEIEKEVILRTEQLAKTVLELRRSEESVKAILDAITSTTAVLNESGTIVAVNRAWRKFLGENSGEQAPNTSVGSNYLDVCRGSAERGDALAHNALEGIQSVLTRRRETFDLVYPCHSPEVKRWFLMRVVPLPTGGAVLSHIDITNLKRTEKKLAEQHELMKAIAENTLDAVFVKNIDGRYLFINSAGAAVFGLDPQEVLGNTDVDLFPGEASAVITKTDREVMRGSGPMVLEEVIEVDGKLLTYSSTKSPFFDAEGNLKGMVGIARDVTRRKEMEVILKESEERFRNLCEHTPIGIIQTNDEGSWIYTNPAWRQLTGLGITESLGQGWLFAVHDEDRESVIVEWQRAVVERQPFWREFRLERHSKTIWIDCHIAPMFSDDGQLLGYIGAAQDVTIRRAAQEAIKSASTAKSLFLANMSHELRTPLTSVIGYAEILADEGITPKDRKEVAGSIIKNSKHLLGVISNILDVTKIEAGKLELSREPSSLFEVMEDVASVSRSSASKKGLSFDIEYTPPVPAIITTDGTRLRQILINLTTNAIKFTPSGKVRVAVSCNPASKLMVFKISDTGIGLTEEQAHHLFQAFSQADASTTRNFGGTGLGLFICKQLATQLGGDITVASVYGSGTTFTATIGISPADLSSMTDRIIEVRSHEGITLSSSTEITGRVLVAEDGEDNQQFLSFLLKRAKVDFVLAENGEKALNMARAQSFDLILMDMQMPIMDGYAATRTLREEGCNIPIIALTANTMKADVERCFEVGCTDFVPKPFEVARFLEKVRGYLSSSPKRARRMPVQEEEDPILGFINRLPTRVTDLQRSEGEKDWAWLQVLAHRLKGAAGLMGFDDLESCASTLEEKLKTGDYRSVSSHIDAIKRVAEDIVSKKGEIRTEL